MHDPSSTPAPAPLSGPEIPLLEPAAAAAAALAALAGELPGDVGRNAQVADRLGEELAELAQMLRSLPGRPAEARGHDWQLLAGLRSAHTAGEDVAEAIARALAR